MQTPIDGTVRTFQGAQARNDTNYAHNKSAGLLTNQAAFGLGIGDADVALNVVAGTDVTMGLGQFSLAQQLILGTTSQLTQVGFNLNVTLVVSALGVNTEFYVKNALPTWAAVPASASTYIFNVLGTDEETQLCQNFVIEIGRTNAADPSLTGTGLRVFATPLAAAAPIPSLTAAGPLAITNASTAKTYRLSTVAGFIVQF